MGAEEPEPVVDSVAAKVEASVVELAEAVVQVVAPAVASEEEKAVVLAAAREAVSAAEWAEAEVQVEASVVASEEARAVALVEDQAEALVAAAVRAEASAVELVPEVAVASVGDCKSRRRARARRYRTFGRA